MHIRPQGVIPMILILSTMACQQRPTAQSSVEADTTLFEPQVCDTLSEVEQEIDVADETARLDNSFDDFLFAFTRSRRLRTSRIAQPLYLARRQGGATQLQLSDVESDFVFLEGDYYTVMYGDAEQIDEEGAWQDTMACVERINLMDATVRIYDFHRQKGRWMLTALTDTDFETTGNGDFLQFYSRFTTDSLYQSQRIASRLRVSMPDPEEQNGNVEGFISAGQWSSFCTDMPSGIISNIRYGQHYGLGQMVLLKCSMATGGLQELFTFIKDHDGWKLTAYEN